MPKQRLGKADLRCVLLNSSAMEIVVSAEQRRRSERLIGFGLARKHKPTEHDVYGLELTPLGQALSCHITRAVGGKLKRLGVQLLAKHRETLRERFAFERGLYDLQKELPIKVTVFGGPERAKKASRRG